MTALWLIRARLKRDAGVQALAQLLLPNDPNQKVAADHHLIWALMAENTESKRDFLYRVEAPGQFLVLASRVPDNSALFDVEAKPFVPVLAEGDRLGFLLRANATISRRAEPGQRGKRQDIVMDRLFTVPPGERAEKRQELVQLAGREWFDRIAKVSGFEPIKLGVDGYEQIRVKRDDAKPLVLSQLDFSGLLQITDPASFLAALAQGFGRGRAFGLGLMLIRRAM
jgi:CRISPR system Cascade subunit CasE